MARHFGAPRVLGAALRTAGLVEGDRARLHNAVTVLEGSSARLELARALVDFGAATRRAGQRAASREPLRRGLDLARQAGATRLAREARPNCKQPGIARRHGEVS